MNSSINLSKPILLIFPFDLLSHYLRCLELSKYLRKDYEIKFALSPAYNGFIEKEGFTNFFCKNFDSNKVMECAKKFDFSWLNEKDLDEVYTDQLRCIQALKPKVVLGDTSPTLKMAAEKAGVKYIALMNGYMSKHYASIRKLSRTHPAYLYSKKLPENIFDFITKIAEKVAFEQVHNPFKMLRRKYGLKTLHNYLDELEGDINLLCDLQDLFPQKRLPANYIFIRPLFHSSDLASNIQRKINPGKKTIFVSMGSSGDWQKLDFLNDSGFSEYNIVTAADNNKILNAPHIISSKFINASELFPSTDLVICHGGNGTIYQALSFGIPVLCHTTHFEQEWNVHGLERLKLGRSLNEIYSQHKIADIIKDWVIKKETAKFAKVKSRIEEEINLFGQINLVNYFDKSSS